jgi:hypothetical protein
MPRKLAAKSKINIISPSKFYLNRVGNGNDDISSKEHFINLKTKRGSYLLQELLIFVQIFEIS